MSSMAQSVLLNRKNDDKSATTYTSHCEGSLKLSGQYGRSSQQLRSVSKLTPSKDLNSTCMYEDESDIRRFHSPEPKVIQDAQVGADVLNVLKGELAILRDQVGALLTEDDRKRLDERRRLKKSLKQRSSFPRVKEFDTSYIQSEAGYQQIQLLLSENDGLRNQVKELEAKFYSTTAELSAKNKTLLQKNNDLEATIAKNSKYLQDYKDQVEAELGTLRRAQEQALRLPKELQRITKQRDSLNMQLESLRKSQTQHHTDQLEQLTEQNHALKQQLERATQQHQQQLDKILKEANAHSGKVRYSDQAKNNLINVLRMELAVLREEVGELLTEDDRRKLEERRNLRRKQKQSPLSDQIVEKARRGFAQASGRNLVQDKGQTQKIISEKIQQLQIENSNLRKQLLNVGTTKSQLENKNSLLQKKINDILISISKNEALVSSQKAKMEIELQLLRKAKQEAANLQFELDRITKESFSLKSDSDNLNTVIKKQTQQLEVLYNDNATMHQLLEDSSRQKQQNVSKTLKSLTAQHTSELSSMQQQNTQLKNELQIIKSQQSSIPNLTAELQKVKRALVEEQMSHQQNVSALSTELKLKKSASSWLEQEQKEGLALRDELMRLRVQASHNEAAVRENQHLREELQRVQALLANRQSQYDRLLEKHYEDVKKLRTKSSQYEYNSAYLKGELDRVSKCLSEKEGELVRVCECAASEARQRETVMNSLKEQINTLNFKIAENERSAVSLQNHIKSLLNRGPETEGTLNVLKAELEGTKKQLKLKQEELTRKHQEMLIRSKYNEQAIGALNKELVMNKEKLSKALTGGSEWKADEQKFQQEISNLRNQLEVLKNSSRQTQKLADELSRSRSQYETKISQISQANQEENNRLNVQVDDLRRQNQQVYQRIDSMNAKLHQKDEENTRLKNEKLLSESQQKQLEAEIVSSASEINSLRGLLQSKTEHSVSLQNKIQRLKADIQTLKDKNQEMEKQLDNGSLRESHSFQKQRLIKDQQGQIKSLHDNLNIQKSNYSNLQHNNKDLKDKCQKLQSKLNEKNNELMQKHEELMSSKKLYDRKLAEILSEKERWRMSDRNTEQSKLIELLEGQLKQQAQDYDDIILNLKRQISARSNFDVLSSNSDMASIDSALRGQFEEVNTMKKELQKKSEDLYRLKDQLSACRSDFDNLRSELEIEKLKGISERKNMQVAFDIELQNMKNDLSSERRVNQSLAQKIKYLNEENKKKDSFIQSYIVGKKLQTEQRFQLENFFQQYAATFPKQGIRNALFSEVQQINHLTLENQQLKAQIAKIKGYE